MPEVLRDDCRLRLAIGEDVSDGMNEGEVVVAERGDVAGEEGTPGREAPFQVLGRRLEGGRRVRLGAGDLRRDPQRAVHAIARDEVAGGVDDGDRDLEVQLLRLRDAALDGRTGLLQAEHDAPPSTGMSTHTSPASTRAGYVGTRAPRPGNTQSPVRTSYIQPCHGHARRVPDSLPSASGPPLCEHTAPHA